MRTAAVLGALIAALLLQTTISGISMAGATRVNLVLVVVIDAALAFGAAPGLLAGTAGGLAQDALTGGVIGVGGLSKTIVGFLVGVLGAQFIVAQPLTRFVMFVGATFLHEVCYQGLFAVVESRHFRMQYSTTLIQALVNAVIGIVAFLVVEKGPEMHQRRQSRPVFGRRRF
ncbi:MAG: rod shape-determining protein MreD [Acidobacteriota bacterium]